MKKTTDLKESQTAHKTFGTLLARGGKILTHAVLSLFVLAFANAGALGNTYTVSNTADSGGGSFRQAIIDANNHTGADDIFFAVPANSTIAPATSLPQITDTVTIGSGSVFFLDGSSAGSTGIGLRVSAPNCIIQGMIITRFQEAGIRIDGGGNNTIVRGNFIGTNAANDAELGNFNRGILIVGTTGNTIGGPASGNALDANRNIISGNQGRGIEITAGGAATIINNYIGTTNDGLSDLGNTQQGILIANSSGSQIGNGTVAGRNVISGNGSHGIAIIADVDTNSVLKPASNNSVLGNFIGTDATGNAKIISNSATMTRSGNDGSGISIQAANNTIGGIGAATRNVIAGNAGNGISISTSLATGNQILGNSIGIGLDGATVIFNRDNGVQISNFAKGNQIGNTVAATRGGCTGGCNVIASNGDPTAQSARAGVYVDSTTATGNSIRGNSIFANVGLGIDLGISPPITTPPTSATGTTPNDAGDPDTGANDLQNFPTLSAADSNGTITGTLNSLPNTVFAIDFYANAAADAGTGEGRTYIGSTSVVTDNSGNATIGYAGTSSLIAGQTVTATATNASTTANDPAFGDTSEFSSPTTVTAATTTNDPGLEGDVYTRPSGDGTYTSVDIAQVRRFYLGQDQPFQSNEFQRADCYPYNTRGDGVLTTLDIAQTRRYFLGLDSPQTAGGPTSTTNFNAADANITAAKAPSKTTREAPQAPRTVRVVSTTANPNSTVTVTIGVDAAGDESIYGFSINYNSDNSGRLTNPVINNPSPATRQISSSLTPGTNPGQFGVTVDFSGATPSTIAPGNNQVLLTITFTVPASATNGTVPIIFTDSPSPRSVSSDPNAGPPVALATTFTDGSVTIGAAPTASDVTVKGRVTVRGRGIAEARVSMTGGDGKIRYATTGAFGYYQFTGVPAGETYVFRVRAKRYEFAAQTISVNEDVDNLNFAGR
jgi:hypothetical protein